MTGGLQQRDRVLRHLNSAMSDIDARKILDRADRQLQPPQIAPAEDLQADIDRTDDGFPLGFAVACAIAVAFIIWRHAPWAADLLERAAR
jgi:hypothetical protein